MARESKVQIGEVIWKIQEVLDFLEDRNYEEQWHSLYAVKCFLESLVSVKGKKKR